MWTFLNATNNFFECLNFFIETMQTNFWNSLYIFVMRVVHFGKLSKLIFPCTYICRAFSKYKHKLGKWTQKWKMQALCWKKKSKNVERSLLFNIGFQVFWPMFKISTDSMIYCDSVGHIYRRLPFPWNIGSLLPHWLRERPSQFGIAALESSWWRYGVIRSSAL